MGIQTRNVEYASGGVVMEGLLAWDDAVDRPRPGVMVAHTIAGRSALEERKARQLAEMGYVAFVSDAYGVDSRGNGPEENRAMMESLKADRPGLQQRLLAALDTMRAQAEVDASSVAAIGFCFGGLCVLDIARTGADVAGVASFHGLFTPPGNTAGNTINAKVLVLHGWDDPMATPEQAVALTEEMSAMHADWQLHAYGNTMHAFTNPGANDSERGTVYNENADRRSWAALRGFLAELFA